jgi:hypothetical protein
MWPFQDSLARVIRLILNICGLLLVSIDHFRELYSIYMHRLLVAVRETSGFKSFDLLPRPPRSVCLVMGADRPLREIQLAARTMLSSGCERVIVCHKGPSSLTPTPDQSFEEFITTDMGKSQIAHGGQDTYSGSNVDMVLLLSPDYCRTGFSPSAVKLEKCVNASSLYYSELVPLYSLHPSDVYLALSMFQSKSQRFGR